jgi:hypothetical protein
MSRFSCLHQASFVQIVRVGAPTPTPLGPKTHARVLAFDEPISGQQAIEEQDEKSSSSGNQEPFATYGSHALAFEEK